MSLAGKKMLFKYYYNHTSFKRNQNSFPLKLPAASRYFLCQY